MSIYAWVRNHRAHHKYSDTDADPHNSRRGFFFSHIGWLLVRKHPEVIAHGKTIKMDDMDNDPVVQFQKKYAEILATIFTLFVPTLIPYLFWNESFYTAFYVNMFRYFFGLVCL